MRKLFFLLTLLFTVPAFSEDSGSGEAVLEEQKQTVVEVLSYEGLSLIKDFGKDAKDVLTEYGPEVVDTTLLLIRLDALANLLAGVFFLFVIPGFIYWKLKVLMNLFMKEGEMSVDEAGGCTVSWIAFVCLSFICFTVALSNRLIQAYYFIAIISPEAGLLYKVGEKIGIF